MQILSDKIKIACIPIVIALIGSITSFTYWKALTYKEYGYIGRTVKANTRDLIASAEKLISDRILSLQRIAGRWITRGGTPKDEWRADTHNYRVHHADIEAIAWIDPSFYVCWTEPTEGNEKIQDINLAFEKETRVTMEEAKEHNKITVSHTIDLMQEGKGFLVFLPLYIQERFDGFILGVFQIQKIFDLSLSTDIQTNYAIVVSEDNERIYSHNESDFSQTSNLTQSSAIEFYNTKWHVHITPRPEFIDRIRSNTPETALFVGLAISFLLAAITYLYQRKALSEKVLKQREENLKAAQQIAHIGSWEWNIIDDSETWTDEQFRIFGYQPGEVEATYALFLKALHPEDKERVLLSVNKALHNNVPFSIEFRIIRPNSEVRTVHAQGTVYRDVQGKPVRMAGTVHDITESRRLEEEIKKTARFPLENPNPVLRISRDGKILFSNKAGELFLNAWHCRVNDVVPDDIQKTISAAFTAGTEKQKENIFNNRIYLMRYVPIVREGYVNLYSLDITDRRNAEEALKKLNETLEQRVAERTEELLKKSNELTRLIQAIEQSPTCIVITDTNGNIEYINPRFTELTGYTFDEAKGQNPRILKSGKTPPEKHTDLWETITSGRTWQGELINRKKDGTLYRELASISPLRNSEEKITHYLAFKDDITEIRRLEEEQQELKEQLYHSQKLESVGRLAGGMAHDLNNILMAIIGYSNLAELELNEDSPAARHLQKILASANRAVELTKSLLAFSRRQPIALEPVNLNELINRMELLIVKLTGEVITYKFQHTLKKCVVMADSDKLEQVLINLITNAKDAMPGGGTLTIATDIVTLDNERAKLYGLGSAGSYILISVSDTGIGMDEETKEKIFEPFFTTKEKGRGTGLGLSIAYGIIKQLNGHIEVMSEPNRGTTFHIYLPETKNEITKTGTEAPKNTPAVNTSGKTILLAEDEAAVREVVTKILEKKGYTVIPAIDGEDAVNKFTEHKDSIDMLLFDVMMPKKNGKEAYDIIKQARPGIKVLFMSGYSEHVATNKNIHEEGLYFLQKPVIPDKLANKISEIIAC